MTDKQTEMVVRIVSVDTDTEIEKKDGGTYRGAEVIYKTADGKTNTKGMHSNTFRYNKTLLAQLQELQKGDYVKVVTKKEGDFVNWVTVEKTERPVDTATEFNNVIPGANKPTTARESYNDPRETREERGIRQVMIVRQSSLATAVNFFSTSAKAGDDYVPSPEDVITVAKEFEAYVLGTTPPFDAEDNDVAQPE